MDAIVALNPDLTNQKTIEPPAQVNNHHVLISARARVRIVRSFSSFFFFDQHATVDETIGERKKNRQNHLKHSNARFSYFHEIDRDCLLHSTSDLSRAVHSYPCQVHTVEFTSRATFRRLCLI